MVVTNDGEVNFQHWIEVLQNKLTTVESRMNAYHAITRFMKDGDSGKFDHFVSELLPRLESFLQSIYADCQLAEGEVPQAALQTFGFSLYQDDITKHISEHEGCAVLDVLCDVIYKTTDKNICTRALWCLAKQTLHTQVVAKKIERLVSAIEHGQCQKMFKSMTVEHEALNALIRLLEQVPEAMAPLGVKWGPLVYGPLVHGAPLVRDKAVVAMEMGFSYLLACQEQIAKRLAADLKAEVLISEMKRLLKNSQESHVLTVWMYYVRLLGKTLHSGSLINHLLPIVEQGFKNPSPKVKVQAYKGWETLIDNFALNPEILGDHKRVKLLMQVFRINNAKYENVALAKLQAWWHFVVKLGDKVVQYFEQVCVPLLLFCVSGTDSQNSKNTPSGKSTPNPLRRGSLGSPVAPSSPGLPQSFRSVQLRGVQVLAQIIGRHTQELDNPRPQYDIAMLPMEVLPGIHFFLKHEKTLVGVVMQAVANMGDDIQDELLYYLWQSLVRYVHLCLEVTSKKEHSDCFSHFCTGLRELVNAQSLHSNKLLKLLHPVVNLPEKCLSSLAYQIDEAGALNQGCPALFLIQVLLNHRLLETSSSNERFLVLLEKLIGLGFSNETAALSFCDSLLRQFGQQAGNVDSKETLWRMWSVAANGLLLAIKKTSEVNQGNNLDHDFSALFATLMFPVLHIITSDLTQGTLKTLLKTWGDVYVTFNRLAAMVATVQANLVCEELCALILEGITEMTRDTSVVESLLHQCEVMVKHLDFSGGTLSTLNDPAHFFGKKKELGNLTSFVDLLDRILKSGLSQPKECNDHSTQFYLTSVAILSTLFSHLPSPLVLVAAVGKLADSAARLLKANFVKSMTKAFAAQYSQKSEKLWLDISTNLVKRYSGPHDSDLLKVVSPILEATFLHPRRAIKNQTMVFWNGTFAKSQSLVYPESLKPVLVRVKDKGYIALPGFDMATTVTVLDNTLGSQTTQGESQFAVPLVGGVSSPKKEFGSFLNKVMSPKKSPLKSLSPLKEGIENKRKPCRPPLDITDMNSKDFVIISTTPKRKRVLTEHQREVMKEQRGNLPALYSNLEASMDASLMGVLNTSNTQGESQIGSLQSPESEKVTSFPFMKTFAQTTTEPSETVGNKTLDQKTNANGQGEEEEEKPSKRRRRSVRFSDDSPNTEKVVPKDTKNKSASSTSTEDNKMQDRDVSPSQDIKSRRSKRIKATKVVENDPPETNTDKNSSKKKKETDSVASIVSPGHTNDFAAVVSDGGNVGKQSSLGNVFDDVSSKVELLPDSGVICDVKTCDIDASENQPTKPRSSARNVKKIPGAEANVNKCDTDSLKGDPFKVQGRRRSNRCLGQDSERDKCETDSTTESPLKIQSNTRIAKKSVILDSEAETCEITENEVSQDLISSPTKTRQLKLSDIITPTSDHSSSLLKSPDSDLETASQSKSRKTRSGALKPSQSDSDSSNVVESPKYREYRSLSNSSRSDSDASNVVLVSPRKEMAQKNVLKSLAKSPLKRAKSAEVRSPVKVNSPKKQASLEGMSTIDKWFKKSPVTDTAKEGSVTLPMKKQSEADVGDIQSNNRLFAKPIETQTCTVSLVRVDPVVMAEDTQQFSPIKQPCVSKSPGKEQVSVSETPVKQDDGVQSEVAKNKASRQLDKEIGGMNTKNVVPDKDISSINARNVVLETQLESGGDDVKESIAEKLTSFNSRSNTSSGVRAGMKFSEANKMSTEDVAEEKNSTRKQSNQVDEPRIEQAPEDVFDDVIPSSQDSFGFAVSFSGGNGKKAANRTVIERPFAMFSESRKPSNQTVQNSPESEPMECGQVENSVESEPVVCGQVVENATPVVESCHGKVTAENKGQSQEETMVTEKFSDQEFISNLTESEKTVITESEIECVSQQIDLKRRPLRKISQVGELENGENKSLLEGTGLMESNSEIVATDKSDEITNNDKVVQKYRGKRRSGRMKISEKDKIQNEIGKDEGNNCTAGKLIASVSSQDGSESLEASQGDNSQSLFGSVVENQVEIVEIKRKTRGRKKKIVTTEEVKATKSDEGKTVENSSVENRDVVNKIGLWKKRQSDVNSNEMESVLDDVVSDSQRGKSEVKENNNKQNDTDTKRSKGKVSANKEEISSSKGNKITLHVKNGNSPKKVVNSAKELDVLEKNVQNAVVDECDLPLTGLIIQKQSELTPTVASTDEDELCATDLKCSNSLTDDEDDVPLTNLKKVTEKKEHHDSPEYEFSANQDDLTPSQLSKSNVVRNKKNKKERLKDSLHIDMKTTVLTKPKAKSSPNAFMRVRLRRKSNEKLKLKKASPKRKRRSKELVSKGNNVKITDTAREGENEVIEHFTAEEHEVMVIDSCENDLTDAHNVGKMNHIEETAGEKKGVKMNSCENIGGTVNYGENIRGEIKGVEINGGETTGVKITVREIDDKKEHVVENLVESVNNNKIAEMVGDNTGYSGEKDKETMAEKSLTCDKKQLQDENGADPEQIDNSNVRLKEDAPSEPECPIPSPVKRTESPHKTSVVKSSPPKKGKPFEIPATPTSSVSKVMGMTRADYIFQKSRLLMGRQASTPSPLHRRSLRAVRSAFSEPRRRHASILKKSPGGGGGAESPVRTNQMSRLSASCSSPPSIFRPVNLPQIYSPSASPSAGILKRQRISGDSPTDSPSPPNKQRRVSFADSVEMRLFENAGPRSRLSRPSSPRPVSRCLDMPKNTQSPLVTAEVMQNAAKGDEATPTPDSAATTQESQLNMVDPIYPSLVACNTPVDQILPQLTTSVWCRGLGQLLRGKSITTVGQLSMLTESQIYNLPIRSPKVETARNALDEFAKGWLSLKKDVLLADTLDSSIDSDPGLLETSGDLLDEIKQLEEESDVPEIDTDSPRKLDFPFEAQTEVNDKATKDKIEAVEKIVGDNGEIAESFISKVSDNREAVELSIDEVGDTSVKPIGGDFDRKLKRQSILNGIRSLHDMFTADELSQLSSHSLVQIQMELNSMMSNVVAALRNKVPLSPSSQSSQE